MEVKYFKQLEAQTETLIQLIKTVTETVQDLHEQRRIVVTQIPKDEKFTEEQDERMFQLMQELEEVTHNFIETL